MHMLYIKIKHVWSRVKKHCFLKNNNIVFPKTHCFPKKPIVFQHVHFLIPLFWNEKLSLYTYIYYLLILTSVDLFLAKYNLIIHQEACICPPGTLTLYQLAVLCFYKICYSINFFCLQVCLLYPRKDLQSFYVMAYFVCPSVPR